MRIGIDARMMGPEVRGIGRYVSKLIEHLAIIDRENEYTIFTRTEAVKLVPASMQTVVTDIPWYGWHEQRELPAIFDGTGLDLMHVPHWNAPLRLRTPLVVTIHDMILWEHRSLKSTTLSPFTYYAKYFAYRHVVSANARRARKILAVSETTRQAIERTLHVPSEKISVTPLGFDPLPIQTLSLPFPILGEGAYILSVGSGYPHKDLFTFFQAADQLMNDDKSLHAVIVGTDPAFLPRIKKEAEKIFLGNMPRVHFLGIVADADLGALYANANALLFTSLDEGFGLPPLEAAAAGTPVIASDIPAVHETMGEDACSLVPPQDIEGFIEAYRRLMSDAVLKNRLIAAGKTRAGLFSWEKTARSTLAAYRAAVVTR